MGRFINADIYTSTGQGMLGNNTFCYCNNNPENGYDFSGTRPWWFVEHPYEPGLYEFTDWYQTANENETTASGQLTLNAKLKQSIHAAISNIIVDAGIGLGLFGGFDMAEYASIEMGIHYDLLHCTYQNGQLDIYQYYCQGIEASMFYLSAGDTERMTRPYFDHPALWAEDTAHDILPVYGFSAYVGAGGTFAVGFDLIAYIYDMDRIWRKQ